MIAVLFLDPPLTHPDIRLAFHRKAQKPLLLHLKKGFVLKTAENKNRQCASPCKPNHILMSTTYSDDSRSGSILWAIHNISGEWIILRQYPAPSTVFTSRDILCPAALNNGTLSLCQGICGIHYTPKLPSTLLDRYWLEASNGVANVSTTYRRLDALTYLVSSVQ